MEIEKIHPNKGIRFERILTMQDRNNLVEQYLHGISISALTRIFGIHHSSIHYHLKKAGVHRPHQPPLTTFRVLKFTITPKRHIDYHSSKNKYNWNDNEKNFPKTYLEYLQRDRERNNILTKHGITDPKTTFLSDEVYDTDVIYGRREHLADLESRRETVKKQHAVFFTLENPLTQ